MSNLGNKETMAKNLKYYLEINKLNQRELAEIINVAPATMNDWIKARKYPRIDKIEIMANYFGIKKSDLVEEKENAPTQRDKSIETIMALFRKLDNDQKMEVIMFAANLIGNNEPKSTDFPSSTGQSE